MTGSSGVPEATQILTRRYMDWLRAAFVDAHQRADVLDDLMHSIGPSGNGRIAIYVDPRAYSAAVHLAAVPRPPAPDTHTGH